MTITIGEKDFLNQKEACLYMGVSRETLKEWEIDGLRCGDRIKERSYITKNGYWGMRKGKRNDLQNHCSYEHIQSQRRYKDGHRCNS